ncbi:lipopolysaccharide biosynthesis protein, partial [Proteus mirabilis]
MSVINNAKWVTVSQLFRIITQIISITVLTRFIEPSEFGILALATIITNFALVIKDLGLSSAIIQKKELTNALKNTVFWLNILFGFSLYILIIILSKPISNYYEQNKLINVLWLLGTIFPISSISALHQALLERDSRFKIIAKIEIISSLFGVVIALILAINNYGVYSIVYQLILTQLISSILILINKKWVPSFTFNKKQIKSILEFSSNITIFNIINYFSRNADNIIVGSTFSTTILGVYNLAYRIMLFPLQSVTFIAN